MKTFSTVFIIFGILWCLLGGFYFWLKNDSSTLSFNSYKPTEEIQINSDKKQEIPVRIIISDLKIDLPLIPAKVENDKWETTHNGASYLISSPIPGNDGNSIIYGHNWNSLLGNLTKATPGQVVEVSYADKSKKRFVIEYVSTVSPSDSSVLENSSDKRITIYTCTGFLDSRRFVAVALLTDTMSFANISRP